MMRDRLVQLGAGAPATHEEAAAMALGLLMCRADASAYRHRIRQLEVEIIGLKRDLGHCRGTLATCMEGYELLAAEHEKLRAMVRATGVVANAPTLPPPPGEEDE